ncbi:MAG: FAD-dependent oxidoreductase [Xanthomonadales bacterium]|nr:FAD-dependent oxidoreductase [Xanthomonadales bacterium]
MKRRHFIQSSAAAAFAAALPTQRALAAALVSMGQVQGEVLAVTGDGAQIALEKAEITELGGSLRGRLLLPGNEGYDLARRVLNPGIDKHPALIVQPSGPADIMSAVNFARERKLLVAVKCGGHSYGGKSTCDGGLQIDLSSLRNARVDAGARTAYVAGGSLLGELDREAMALGLVTTAGTVSHTGVGGLTLGGGFGRLARRYGLALDNVTGVDIVTADGRLRHASAEENPDLFWGVRGGGGNFGIVTSFEFQLHPMERTVIGGDVVFPAAQLRDVLAMYADYIASAPDELYLDCVVTSKLGTTDVMAIIHACYSGPPEQAAKVLAPIYKAGSPVHDGIGAVDYVALQRSWDNTDPRNTNEYLKSGFINEFPAKLAEAVTDNFQAFENRGTTILFQHSGGAISRVPTDATAFAHRKSLANMMAFVEWPLADSREEHIAYTRSFWSGMQPFTDGWYSNEVANESAKAVNRNYQGNYARMVQVKNRYDPGNLFRLNANVEPTV